MKRSPMWNGNVKTGRRIYDGTEAQLYMRAHLITQWADGIFVSLCNGPTIPIAATSQQDAIDHPEKYPYHSASNGKQTLVRLF
ncbi:MAG: hypothetical protein R2738_04425 [Bacteroides graminisolvens]